MAKINISVSSDSSKPRITISKGPVGPQGEQGIQGEVGPQGPAGTVLELSAIPDVILNNEPPVLPGSYSQSLDLIQNILTWDPNYNGVGRWTYLGDVTLIPPVVSAPPPGQAFVYRAIGENLTAVSSLSSNIMGVGVSGSMPNDVKLYVDGDSRFNGSVEIASGGATVYTLPTADGTANQVMKTDGSGNVTFGGLPLLASNGITQSIVNGINLLSVSNNLGISSLSTTNDVTVGGDIYFAGSETKLIRPFDAGIAAGPLTIQSNGDLVIELDQNADEVDKAFIVKNGADAEVFNVNESGEVRVNNAYTLPTTDSNANYFLKTDGSGQLFFATVNGTSGNVGASPPPPPTYSLDDLTDVDTTTVAPAAGQALVWSGSQWEPGAGSPWTATGNDIYYNTGKVGIGTNAPLYGLHLDVNNGFKLNGRHGSSGEEVIWLGNLSGTDLEWRTNGAATTTIKAWTGSSSAHAYQRFYPSGGETWSHGVYRTTNQYRVVDGLDISVDANARIVVDGPSGNVGIGTTTPTEALDVVGVINSSGKIVSGGVLQWSGGTYQISNGTNSVNIGKSMGTGSNGVAIGADGGGGTGAIVIGGQAKAGSYSVAIGQDVGAYSNAGSNSVHVGRAAGNNSTGTGNTSVGHHALFNPTTGEYNVAIGKDAAYGGPGATFANTVAVGYQALTALTTGAGNTAVGYQAGTAITSGNNNTAVGYQALTTSTTGYSNTAVGEQAGAALTTGGDNVFIGRGAGKSVTNKYESVFIGRDAGSNGSAQVGIGKLALAGNNNEFNIGIGYNANRFGSGIRSVAVGWSAGYQGNNSYAASIGHFAGQNGGINGFYAGYQAGQYATGTDNVIIGHQSAQNAGSGGYNTIVGSGAAVGVSGTSTFANTVAVGYQALTALTTGVGNTAVGYQAGAVLTDASSNTMLGYKAGNSVTQGNNTLIGYQAGKDLGSTTNLNGGNTFIGSNAGHLAAYQTGNTYIGYNAAAGNAGNNSYSSVVIGFNAAPYTTPGQTHTQAVMVGAEAAQTSGNQSMVTLVGWGTNRFGGARTVAVGHSAAYNAVGGYNVAVGFQALSGSYNQGSSSNTQNVAVGYRAGAAMTTGGGNIFLGYEAGANETGSNKLYIENGSSATPLIYGEFDTDLVRINGDFEVTGNINNSIDALNDVDTTTVAPADGQALVWDNVNSKWEPGDVGVDGFITEVAPDSIKGWQYERGQWVDTSGNIYLGTNLSAGEGHPSDVFLSPDGTSLYMLGVGVDRLYQWTLNTAFDLKTVDLNSEKWVYIGSGSPMALYIADDPSDLNTYGKKFFVLDDISNKVREFLATTAWDITTIDNIGNQGTPSENASYTLTEGPDDYYEGMCFSTDGSKMFISRNSASTPDVQVYDLSVNYDITSVSYNTTQSIDFSNVYYPQYFYGTQDIGTGVTFSKATNIEFNTDGTKLYLVTDFSWVHELNLSTPYDVTTYTHVDTIDFRYQSLPGLQLADGDGRNTFLSDLNGMHYVKNANYVFFMYGHGDEITRLKRDNVVISNATFFQDNVSVDRNLNTTNFVSTGFADINASVFRGAPYFNQSMNWAGFNSGPAVTKGDAFILGPSMKTIAFTNNVNPSGLDAPTTHDINNTTPGTFIMVTGSSSANNIILPASSGVVMLDTDPHYLSRYNTEATASITGATETLEYYYTARADGQGEKERFLHNLPAAGQTVRRDVYYASKAFAVPDTSADWTFSSAYSSYSDALNGAKALLNEQATGTLPLTTKVTTTGLSTANYFTLDSGAMTLGFSLRRLNPDYTGAAIRVINDSGVEADIGFVEEALDTSALLTHCGSGDGYLTVWYDQSQGGATGTGNDATYGNPYYTPTNRPKIVSAGTVLTDNNKPCVFVQGSSMQLASQTDFPNTNGTLFAYVASKDASANVSQGMVFGDYQGVSNQSNRIWEYSTYINAMVYGGSGIYYFAAPEDGTITGAGQHLVTFYRDPSAYWYMDRNSVTSSGYMNRNYTASIETLFNAHNSIAYAYYGNVQEIIAFDSGKSSERAAIKSNINSYYSIY